MITAQETRNKTEDEFLNKYKKKTHQYCNWNLCRKKGNDYRGK